MSQELVLEAMKKSALHAFHQTNQYISKRLAPEQYGQYVELSAVTAFEIGMRIDDRVKKSSISGYLNGLVKAGLVDKKKGARDLTFYWIKDTKYLEGN